VKGPPPWLACPNKAANGRTWVALSAASPTIAVRMTEILRPPPTSQHVESLPLRGASCCKKKPRRVGVGGKVDCGP
jgi:hypothetical protein